MTDPDNDAALTDEQRTIIADAKWWKEFGDQFGWEPWGFSGRNSSGFRHPGHDYIGSIFEVTRYMRETIEKRIAAVPREADIRADERQKHEAWLCERLEAWLAESHRRPAATAFPAGPLRNVARRMEEVIAAANAEGEGG